MKLRRNFSIIGATFATRSTGSKGQIRSEIRTRTIQILTHNSLQPVADGDAAPSAGAARLHWTTWQQQLLFRESARHILYM